MSKVVLQTARLVLREWTRDDIDDLFSIWGDAETMRFYREPFSREQVAELIERNLKRYAEQGFGWWALVRKEDGRFVGDCGLSIQEVDGEGREEIGYHVHRSLWGRGYATEAARAVRDYAFDTLGLAKVISWMTPDNIASRRVAEKNGMTLEKQTVNRYGDAAVVYALAKADRRG